LLVVRAEVDVMIGLTHIGKMYDFGLAAAHSGYDLIVGGHSEDVLADLEAQREKDHAHGYVMQVGHFARILGRADIAVHPDGNVILEHYELVQVDESLPVADDVDELAKRLELSAAPDAHVEVATLAEPIDSGAGMVNLVARAAQDRWGTDALILGSDVFFDGLPQGPVTLQRIYDSVYVQREPSGTTGYSSLYIVSMTGAELAPLKSASRGAFYVIAPDDLSPEKTYKVAIEKRAMTFPALAFSSPPDKIGADGKGRFAGEIIDVLESYAHARTAKGLPL
jgi:2',3'-cyclic-nucleotide 2'-phosphodiesterase (5'-nucleotidase family)